MPLMLRAYMGRVWPTRLAIRYVVVAFVLVFFINLYLFKDTTLLSYFRTPHPRHPTEGYFRIPLDENPHPIDVLLHEARTKQAALLQQRSLDIPSAAARYRERRGRHPPPGFDRWVEHALKTNAVIVEDFFDRIYHDITPFWGLDANLIRQRANSWHHVVRVRNGTAIGDGNTENRVPWLQLWTALVSEMAEHLPDVDMPINYMDESRILVPHEDIAKYIGKERDARRVVPITNVKRNFNNLAETDAARKEPYDPHWMGGSSRMYWEYVRATCPPGSPSRDIPAMTDFALPPSIPYNWQPSYTYKGYVQNFTGAMDPCTQPHLRSLHGTFIEPLSISTTAELIPLFGGCKLPNNNEILIPGAMYLTEDPFYSGGASHGPAWDDKIDGVIWRGVASGGRNQKDNWTHFHRHRLVEMLNGTTVHKMEANGVRAMTFEMPPSERYDFARRRTHQLGDWIGEFADAGFVHLLCFPAGDPETECDYIKDYFGPIEGKPMAEQYRYKFLPDVDGNSFSARFRGFMLSTSLPLKATIYAEWHDDRLMPWLHFVPLDNTFQDLYGVLDYLADGDEVVRTGKKTVGKGDLAARWIAAQGKEWGEKVLRREDMRLYVWRLLLEWARVCDEKREIVGFVDDLMGQGAKLNQGR
jgi:hypothetical protein